MPANLPSFVLAFHGCDRSVANAVISGRKLLKPSNNPYDWLGEGVYFWEQSAARAFEYALLLKERSRRSGARVRNPAVVGAVIDLGNCLNLLDTKFFQVVREGYDALAEFSVSSAIPMPENRTVGPSRELLLRDLDCAVINTIHRTRAEKGLPAFDTVRAAFIEGQPLYPGGGFFDRNHIQICVRNPRCIKGYFRPLDEETGAG